MGDTTIPPPPADAGSTLPANAGSNVTPPQVQQSNEESFFNNDFGGSGADDTFLGDGAGAGAGNEGDNGSDMSLSTGGGSEFILSDPEEKSDEESDMESVDTLVKLEDARSCQPLSFPINEQSLVSLIVQSSDRSIADFL